MDSDNNICFGGYLIYYIGAITTHPANSIIKKKITNEDKSIHIPFDPCLLSVYLAMRMRVSIKHANIIDAAMDSMAEEKR